MLMLVLMYTVCVNVWNCEQWF